MSPELVEGRAATAAGPLVERCERDTKVLGKLVRFDKAVAAEESLP
jgi:hypothetical protein